jgi:hypothetical protein
MCCFVSPLLENCQLLNHTGIVLISSTIRIDAYITNKVLAAVVYSYYVLIQYLNMDSPISTVAGLPV